MKTAIYIEDGVVQLVITPDSEFEKAAIASFGEKPLSVKVFEGSFYNTQGGWIRHKDTPVDRMYWHGRKDDQSLILRIDEAKTTAALPSAGDILRG